MLKNSSEKDNFLLAIPGSLSMLDALDEMAPIFVAASQKDQNKHIGNIENYICFHAELKLGVYKSYEKYFVVRITHPSKTLGVYMPTSFFELTELLTDATDDAYLERASIAGATFYGATTSKEEKVFLKALTDYDKLILDSVAIELKDKIRSEKENESSDMPNESTEEAAVEESLEQNEKKVDDLFDDI